MREPVNAVCWMAALLTIVCVWRGAPAAESSNPNATPGREATQLATVKPRRNRYTLFRGNLLHGVLDARGRTPGKRLPGPRGRLRVTLVVNFWDERPSEVPTWAGSGIYRRLGKAR